MPEALEDDATLVSSIPLVIQFDEGDDARIIKSARSGDAQAEERKKFTTSRRVNEFVTFKKISGYFDTGPEGPELES